MFAALALATKYLSGFFDESAPQSFSRLVSIIIVFFVLGWDTCYLKHTHLLPDVATMAGQVGFMTAFYVVRRMAGAYTDTRNPPEPPKPSGN